MTNNQKNDGKGKTGRKQRQIRNLMLATIVGLIVIFGGYALYHFSGNGASQSSEQNHDGDSSGAAAKDKAAMDSGGVKAHFNYDAQPMLGNEDAPVKIVEFGDYRCSVCYHFDQKFFPKLKKQFIETGKASFYFMNYPILGQGSVRAALASESVFRRSPEAFWKYHETVYDHQGPEDKEWATTDFLVRLAKKNVQKIDPATLRKDIEKATYLLEVKKDAKKGKELGLQGTPTVFVNGRMLSWDETSHYGKLKDIIENAYKKADQANGDK